MAKKSQPRNEFRKHKPSGHIKYIYEKVGDEFVFLGLTHSSSGRRIKLNKNPEPNPKDSRDVYIEIDAEQNKVSKFRERKQNWKFDNSDVPMVEEIKKENKKRSAPSKSKK